MSERYDVAIIGTGPAGLSAAITLRIRNKQVILFGNPRLSEKIEKAHSIENYLGLPKLTGKQLAEHFQRHLKEMEIPIVPEKILTVYGMGDCYCLSTNANNMITATAVILATGVSFGKPYAGELSFLGRGVSYCATCDAALYKGKTVAVVANHAKEFGEAVFLTEYAEKVYYISSYQENRQAEGMVTIQDRVCSIEGDIKVKQLVLEKQTLPVDGVFLLRDSIAPSNLVPGLHMEGNHIRVDRALATNLKGCFACGDITGLPYQYIKAAGEGNVAALSAVKYLEQLALAKKETNREDMKNE